MYKLTFLIPYYNHPATIQKLVSYLSKYELDILIIDDGSNEESKKALREIPNAHFIDFNPKVENFKIHIFTRNLNGGKGAALKDGMQIANLLGFTHIFQIDADMQHQVEKIIDFIHLSKDSPNSLICGNPMYGSEAPKARIYGRKITNFWVFVNTLGGNLKDVMCGMRIYPLKFILPLLKKCSSNRMDFDPEILILAYKSQIPFLWIDVLVTYQDGGISHFKAFKDNLLISKMHAKHFFLLPHFVLSQLFQTKKNWWERKEKAGYIFLNITLFLVTILPRFILNFFILLVTFCYFIFSKEERNNLSQFYDYLAYHQKQKPLGFWKKQLAIYSNFYHFGWAICDKIAVWKGKINHKDLILPNRELMDKELRSLKRGQVLLTSHYGNIEIARALSNEFSKLEITILVYQKNSVNFINMINKISKNKLQIIFIDKFNIYTIFELQKIIDNGGHIGIMGDRVSVSNSKNALMDFLGKPCYFPEGAFLIAGLLKAKISALWCEKIQDKYQIELEVISDETLQLSRDKSKSIRPFLQTYITLLEKRVSKFPHLWFNFYNFWEQNVKTKL
ncbi:MAG: glycosyltransferase family 2 protein [Helicobacter sp.]|nr:glycosyltransferase family 2 protein [Helicobacter sp.]